MKKLIPNSHDLVLHAAEIDGELYFSPIIAWDLSLGVVNPVIVELQPEDYDYLFAVYDMTTQGWSIDNGSIIGNGKEALLEAFQQYDQGEAA